MPTVAAPVAAVAPAVPSAAAVPPVPATAAVPHAAPPHSGHKKPIPPGTYPPGTRLQVGSHRAVIKSYLSEGGFAHVYTVYADPPLPNGDPIACLKRVSVQNKMQLNLLRAEVAAMQRLEGNKTIVRYIDSHAGRLSTGTGYEVFVLMEYCSGNGLIDFMNTRLREQLTEPEILQIACDIGLGVANMHYLSPPLIHRDLKIENVLISGDGIYKLCDFGSASSILPPPRNQQEFQLLDHDIQNNTTAQYRAPEMVDLGRGFPIDEKSDIWAFGVFIYKLCYYTTPFEREGNMAILNSRYTFPSKPAYSDRLKRVINVALTEDPRLRPNIFQCLKELFSMRGLQVPIQDKYTAPTSTIWRDTSLDPFPPAAPIPVEKSSTNPYRTSHTPSSVSSSSLAKTPDSGKPFEPENAIVSDNEDDNENEQDSDAEAKFPTIEELSKDLSQQAFFAPSQPVTPAPPQPSSFPYASSLFSTSFSHLPAMPASSTPIPPVPPLPVGISTEYQQQPSTSSQQQPSTSPWGYQAQPAPYVPKSPFPAHNEIWQTSNPAPTTQSSSVESRSHTPFTSNVPQVFLPSNEDENVGLNRSSSTASRPGNDEKYSPVIQAQPFDSGIQRPRPVSMHMQSPNFFFDQTNEPLPPLPTLQRGYSRSSAKTPTATEGTLIDPLVTNEKDNLKAMLSDLDDKSKAVFSNGELSNTDYLIALSQDTPDLQPVSRHHSRHQSRSPSGKASYMQPSYTSTSVGSNSAVGDDEPTTATYIKSRSASRQGKRSSMSLKSKIGDAFKMFDGGQGYRSSSGQIPRQQDYTGESFQSSKRSSISGDSLAATQTEDWPPRSQGKTAAQNREISPEHVVVRQASFMESEDAAQYERPVRRSGSGGANAKAAAPSLSRHHSVKGATEASANPAYMLQNKIQALMRDQTPSSMSTDSAGSAGTFASGGGSAMPEYYSPHTVLESTTASTNPAPAPVTTSTSAGHDQDTSADPDSFDSIYNSIGGGHSYDQKPGQQAQAQQLTAAQLFMPSPIVGSSGGVGDMFGTSPVASQTQGQVQGQTQGQGQKPVNLMDEDGSHSGQPETAEWRDLFDKKYPSLA